MSNYPETIYCGKNPVRTFTMNGITKFVARDICKLLGYPRADKMLAPLIATQTKFTGYRLPVFHFVTDRSFKNHYPDSGDWFCHHRHHLGSHLG